MTKPKKAGARQRRRNGQVNSIGPRRRRIGGKENTAVLRLTIPTRCGGDQRTSEREIRTSTFYPRGGEHKKCLEN